jgi:hypothetical protein
MFLFRRPLIYKIHAIDEYELVCGTPAAVSRCPTFEGGLQEKKIE